MTKYTPLVKSMQQDFKNKGLNLNLEQTYQYLLKANFIDADGQPTKWAIENGYVGVEYTYPQGMPTTNGQSADDQQIEFTQDENDILTVLGYLPQNAIHYNDRRNLSGIDKEPLKKAIKQALHDDAISINGRKKWKKVLLDLEA